MKRILDYFRKKRHSKEFRKRWKTIELICSDKEKYIQEIKHFKHLLNID